MPVRGEAARTGLEDRLTRRDPRVGPAAAERGDRNPHEGTVHPIVEHVEITEDDVDGRTVDVRACTDALRGAEIGEQRSAHVGQVVDRDHVGAEVGEELRAVRAGEVVRGVEHPHAVVDHVSAPTGRNTGTTTDRSGTVGNESGRNPTCIG